MSRADPKFLVRLPQDVKAFIAAQAERNSSSQNSEIVRCIRDRMDLKTKTATTEPARAE
jgi:predicted HicB family RNase H-like nuclease